MTTADRHTDLDPTVDRHRDGEGYDAEQTTGSHTADGDATYGRTDEGADGFGERAPGGYADRDTADQPADHYGDAVPSTDESHLDGTGHHVDGTDSVHGTDGGDGTVSDPARTEGGYATDGTTDHTVDHSSVTDSNVTDSNVTDGAGTTTTDAVPASGSATTSTGTTSTGTTSTGTTSSDGDKLERLVPADRVQAYTSQWDAVKGEFVDEPRQAVAKADKLVGELLDELDQAFRKQRSDLEHGLDADETSTEDLRLALRKYRSFFDRLLTL